MIRSHVGLDVFGEPGEGAVDGPAALLEEGGVADVGVLGEEGDGDSLGAEPTGPAHPVDEVLVFLRAVVVDDEVGLFDVDSPPEQVGGHQQPGLSPLEPFIAADALLLGEVRVDADRVEHYLEQLLGQLDCPLHRVCEDDDLVEGRCVEDVLQQLEFVFLLHHLEEVSQLGQIEGPFIQNHLGWLLRAHSPALFLYFRREGGAHKDVLDVGAEIPPYALDLEGHSLLGRNHHIALVDNKGPDLCRLLSTL